MTDEELIARLGEIQGQAGLFASAAAARIEQLVATNEALTEQLAAARQDAKEAEAYAEELEQELNTCRMAQAVMDNTVADLEAKLVKAVEALGEIAVTGDWFTSDMNDLIKELKGESHE